MDFIYSAEDEAFRGELREFFQAELPPGYYGSYDKRDDQVQTLRSIRRKLADRGWLTMAWPKEYGGLGRPYYAPDGLQ